jgi:hypothetical protein
MLLFKRKTPADAEQRLAELRTALAETDARLGEARGALGAAVVEGDEDAARGLRAQVEREEARRRELAAALPVAEQRLRDAQEREEERRRAEEARRANELRARRVELARSVDDAWRALAEAAAAYSAAEVPPEDGSLVARRERTAHRAAAYRWASALCGLLAVPHVQPAYRRALAESEAGSIKERQVTDDREDDDE